MIYIISLFLSLNTSIFSEILQEERPLIIDLPENYNPEQAYDLIILLDGNWHLSDLREQANRLQKENKMKPCIIVAVENIDRERDFTVSKIQTKRENTTGGGRSFLGFLNDELLPYLGKNYKLTNHSTLIGHSLGGLLTLSAYFEKDSKFDAFLSIDPSIWWGETAMQEKVRAPYETKLYLATANQGPDKEERNKKRHEKIVNLINSSHVRWEYFETQNHQSIPPYAMYAGLEYLNKNL